MKKCERRCQASAASQHSVPHSSFCFSELGVWEQMGPVDWIVASNTCPHAEDDSQCS